jgi:phosphate transport system permease protein
MIDKKISTIDLVNKNLKKRYRAEKRFQAYGIASICFGLMCLLFLFTDIIGKGSRGFFYHYMPIEIHLDAEVLGITDTNDFDQILAADYTTLVKAKVYDIFEAKNRSQKKDARNLIAIDATGYRIQELLKT